MEKLRVLKTKTPELPTSYLGGYKLHRRRCSAIEQRDFRHGTEGRSVVTAAKVGFGVAHTFLIPRRRSYSSGYRRYSDSIKIPSKV